MSPRQPDKCAKRAAHAERTVRHYSRTPGHKGKADYEADIIDFFTDLRHFCRHRRLDFGEMIKRSERHYEAERKAEPDARRARRRDEDPKCPNCGRRLECEPDQDGSCDWSCPNCGWHQHVPMAREKKALKIPAA